MKKKKLHQEWLTKNWKPGVDFEKKHMAASIKIQHGLELLIEINHSLFNQNVFGCICIENYVRILFDFLF